MEHHVDHSNKRHHLLERIATVLLALATVATAWCAYQSTVWSSVQEYQLHDADTVYLEVQALRTLSMQKTTIDVLAFINYLNAVAKDEDSLASFYQKRFPVRMLPAFNAWVALKPGTNPSAPLTPFLMKEYRVPETLRADSLQSEYKGMFKTASESNAHSEHYVLLTVIFASVMFFGGITSNIGSLSTKTSIVIGSTILLLSAVAWMLTFPTVVR
ncbi:MAG: hypothetical protein HYX66_00830 [Ignavibacteria bacterium]|nr:hypothetical protein [Ignavibacteria bacterium]